MSAPVKHVWDQVAGDVVDWLHEEGPRITAMVRGSDEAPFAAATTEKQKYEYYKSQFFNPDGSENAAGRSQVMDRVGIPGYVQIFHALQKGAPQPQEETQQVTENGTGSTY